MKDHHYSTEINWSGNTGHGTESYKSYERSHTISIVGKQSIDASSDPAFMGDTTKHNPEDLFLSSIASCHMLWFLHLACQNKINVMAYKDHAYGKMVEHEDGSGEFVEVILRPEILIQGQFDNKLIDQLNHEANQKCFIARSLNFKVKHEPIISTY